VGFKIIGVPKTCIPSRTATRDGRKNREELLEGAFEKGLLRNTERLALLAKRREGPTGLSLANEGSKYKKKRICRGTTSIGKRGNLKQYLGRQSLIRCWLQGYSRGKTTPPIERKAKIPQQTTKEEIYKLNLRVGLISKRGGKHIKRGGRGLREMERKPRLGGRRLYLRHKGGKASRGASEVG